MKLKNVLIVVRNIERAQRFYHDLFGLELVLDNDGNMILKVKDKTREKDVSIAYTEAKKVRYAVKF